MHDEQSGVQIWGPSICLINIPLWAWNISWVSFADAIDLPLPFEAVIDYLGCVEVRKIKDKVVVRPHFI